MSTERTRLEKTLQSLPKVDLHRHLEGSLRYETILELSQAGPDRLAPDEGELARRFRIMPGEGRSPAVFLSKFAAIRQLIRSESIIRRIVLEAVEDAQTDGVRYLELHFTPAALAAQAGFSLGEVIDWVISAARQAAGGQIDVGLIASVNRHENLRIAEEVLRLVSEADGGIAGVGLAGDERLPLDPQLLEIFGAYPRLQRTIHAGEWGGADSVRQAMEGLDAQRIGHGVRIIEDPAVVAMARERGVLFEICLTSNYHTGVVKSIGQHPLPAMIQGGLQVVLCSDDPGLSGITLSDEYWRALQELGLSLETLKGMLMSGVAGAFLSKQAKRNLENAILRSLFTR